MADPLNVETDLPDIAAVQGTHTAIGGPGVLGVSPANGVIGRSTGDALGSAGVFGEAITGPGVFGSSTSSVGIHATTQSGPAALRAIHAGNGPESLGLAEATARESMGFTKATATQVSSVRAERGPVFQASARAR